MARYQVPVVPLNYAVWYEYVAGTSHALSTTIDRMVGGNEAIDEKVTRDLYQQYVDPSDQNRVAAAQRTVRKLLEAMSASLDAAGSEVSRYEQSLQECAAQLSDDIEAEELRGLVAGLMASTQQMNASSAALHRHLEESRREAESLREELERVRAQAKTDTLTGLANRMGFEERLKALEESDDYAAHPHCLLIADIDNFKCVNDTYGHLFGDKVIKVVAKAFSNLTKGRDLAARFGGEEFVVLLPQTLLVDAIALAEAIRHGIEQGRVFNPKTGREISRVTISIGVTGITHGEDIEQALARADEALYRAKAGGRNRVEVSGLHPLRTVAG
jgi:diguanylate cyclase